MNETSLTTKFVGIKFSFALKAELTYKQFIYYKQNTIFYKRGRLGITKK